MDSGLSPARRAELTDLAALAELRGDVFNSVGPERAIAVLYGLGYLEGRIDGVRVSEGFEGGVLPEARFAGPGVPLLFTCDSSDLSGCFGGHHARSPEAIVHRSAFPEPSDPVCFVSAGYAAGWFAAILNAPILVREVQCQARGDDRCRFEARRLADWGDMQDDFVTALASELDLPRLNERAREIALDPNESEGPMLGRFDPLSPAAHIWGPVMILPYSGSEDSTDALESVHREMGVDRVRVVVVDVTGARIDDLESRGLAHVLDCVEELGAEAILVGLEEHHALLSPERSLAAPLIARDLSEGIALGFQICSAMSTAS
jgi:hypothetical protein